jgi:superfamily II DNA or RNA helicase
MTDFINESLFRHGPWQALERSVARLMIQSGFSDVRLVGKTGDKGADILAGLNGKRWVVQVKYRNMSPITIDVVDEVLNAKKAYNADIPVIATNTVFTKEVENQQQKLTLNGISLQLWDKHFLLRKIRSCSQDCPSKKDPKEYQLYPIEQIVSSVLSGDEKSGLVIMATGLGKTFVAAEAIRQIKEKTNKIGKVLILAHTNELVYQLEKAFWPFIKKSTTTSIWNGIERGDIDNSEYTFACIDSVISYLNKYHNLPTEYDLIVIDEAHHAASETYKALVENTNAGKTSGPYLLGLTATPWRMDDQNINSIFQKQLCSIDLITAMGNGYLSQVDYRMHVDNINWEHLMETKEITPRSLNKTLFIHEWNDAVIDVLFKTWPEINKPRAIIFCNNIAHAHTVRDRINSRQLARAEVIFSGVFNKQKMSPVQRSKTLCDFADGKISIICAVDIFNEGIDVPDVNLLVFQRVTHSRRIFVQQLGRGLRVSDDKEKVIVLDFVSDIRRFAAGVELSEGLSRAPRYIALGSPVKFMNKGGEDPMLGRFITEWLKDAAMIQDAGEDDPVLKFPPVELLNELNLGNT